MRLAPEGWPFILPGWALVMLGAWVARGSPWVWVPEGALFLIAVWLLVFFRDPARAGPRGEQYVIAPADGKIVDVRVVDEPQYLKAQATRISIFMSVFDVHVNRYPATGTVELVRYNPGRFLHAASDKASLDNEQASVGVRAARGPLLVRQIAGIDAIGIGTDFDGITCTPEGLDDVSKFPNLTRALLQKGYSTSDIKKLYGGNTLRLMRQVEKVAASMQSAERAVKH